MPALRSMLPFVLLLLGLLLPSACTDDGSAKPVDGDATSDGDTDLESPEGLDGDAETSDPENGEEEGNPDAESETDAAEIPDAEEEIPDPDGDDADLPLDEGDGADSADQTDEGAEGEDADTTDTEPEAEPESVEAEPEIETEPLCGPRTSPFDLMRERVSLPFPTVPFKYNGTIAADCQTDAFFFAGPIHAKVRITLSGRVGLPFNGRLILADPASSRGYRQSTVYHDQTNNSDPMATITLEFPLPNSGELMVVVAGRENLQAGGYTLSAQCLEGCDQPYTRFPIVLMHGFAGWDTMIGFYNYFYGVEDDLVGRGFDVHTTQVAMFNDSIQRANEVEAQLMEILTVSGARKLNLLVHSQGGIDARRFISGMNHGADVALLAMVATPNDGTIIGDMILGNVPGIGQDVIAAIVDFFGDLIGGSDNDVKAALGQLSVQNMREVFNPAHPDDPRVTYWSWSGYSCRLVDGDCRDAHDGEWVNPTISITYGLILDGPESEGYGPNDGLVTVNSARYGAFFGSKNADHWDEIGQLTTGGFDHKAFYREIVMKMWAEGF